MLPSAARLLRAGRSVRAGRSERSGFPDCAARAARLEGVEEVERVARVDSVDPVDPVDLVDLVDRGSRRLLLLSVTRLSCSYRHLYKWTPYLDGACSHYWCSCDFFQQIIPLARWADFDEVHSDRPDLADE